MTDLGLALAVALTGLVAGLLVHEIGTARDVPLARAVGSLVVLAGVIAAAAIGSAIVVGLWLSMVDVARESFRAS